MFLNHGVKFIAENQMFLGILFFSFFWTSLVNIAGSTLLKAMGKTEMKFSLVISLILSIAFSLFAVFATYGTLGYFSAWDFLFPSVIAIITPIVIEIYFVVYSALKKTV